MKLIWRFGKSKRLMGLKVHQDRNNTKQLDNGGFFLKERGCG